MKKIISVLLVLALVFSLAACKKTKTNEKSLYDVYENVSEQTDSSTFDIGFVVKIDDEHGDLQYDAETQLLIGDFLSGDNQYEFYFGISGSFDETTKKFAVSLGSDEKTKTDIIEAVTVDGEIYLNMKALYTFVYNFLAKLGFIESGSTLFPAWDDIGFSGDYMKLSYLNKQLSDITGSDVDLTENGILGLVGYIYEMFFSDSGSEDDDGFYFDFDTASDAFGAEESDEFGKYMDTIIGLLDTFSDEETNWISDVIKAIPEKNIKSLMNTAEKGLKDAGVISNESGWYTITLDDNVRKIPLKLADAFSGKLAKNIKEIILAVSEVETLPDSIKTIVSEAANSSDDDYQNMEDYAINEIKNIDLSDNIFTDGDLTIKAAIKTTKKSANAKIDINANVDGVGINVSVTANSDAGAEKASVPSSVMSKIETEGLFGKVAGLLGLGDLDGMFEG